MLKKSTKITKPTYEDIDKFADIVDEIQMYIFYHADKSLHDKMAEKIYDFMQLRYHLFFNHLKYYEIAERNFYYKPININNLLNKFLYKNPKVFNIEEIEKYSFYATSARNMLLYTMTSEKAEKKIIIDYIEHAEKKNKLNLNMQNIPLNPYYYDIMLLFINNTFTKDDYIIKNLDPRFICTFNYLFKVLAKLNQIFSRLRNYKSKLFVKHSFINTVEYYNRIFGNDQNKISYDFDKLSLFPNLKNVTKIIEIYESFPKEIKEKYPFEISNIIKILELQKKLDNGHGKESLNLSKNDFPKIPKCIKYYKESKELDKCLDLTMSNSGLFQVWITSALNQYYVSNISSNNDLTRNVEREISILTSYNNDNYEQTLNSFRKLYNDVDDMKSDKHKLLKMRLEIEIMILDNSAFKNEVDHFTKILREYALLEDEFMIENFEQNTRSLSEPMVQLLQNIGSLDQITSDSNFLSELLDKPRVLQNLLIKPQIGKELLNEKLLEQIFISPKVRNEIFKDRDFMKVICSNPSLSNLFYNPSTKMEHVFRNPPVLLRQITQTEDESPEFPDLDGVITQSEEMEKIREELAKIKGEINPDTEHRVVNEPENEHKVKQSVTDLDTIDEEQFDVEQYDEGQETISGQYDEGQYDEGQEAISGQYDEEQFDVGQEAISGQYDEGQYDEEQYDVEQYDADLKIEELKRELEYIESLSGIEYQTIEEMEHELSQLLKSRKQENRDQEKRKQEYEANKHRIQQLIEEAKQRRFENNERRKESIKYLQDEINRIKNERQQYIQLLKQKIDELKHKNLKSPPTSPSPVQPLYTNLYNSSDFTVQVLDLMDSKLEIIKNDETLQTAYIQYVNNVIQNPLFDIMVNSFMNIYSIDENLASTLLIFLASYDMMSQAGFNVN